MSQCGRRPIIKILVGLPRSGKTTYARNFPTTPTISADQLRYLVYGQRFWEPGEDLMWSIRRIVLEMLLEQRVDIIIDETNTTAARRKPIIDLARKKGYEIQVIIINTPKEVCIERAKAEGDNAIIPVIERMAAQFEAVGEAEADSIIQVDFKEELM